MPIYEYACKACGHHCDELQGINDKPLTKCPSCHKPKLEKIVSAPAFQLKGTGWYATDFKNSGKKPEAAVSEKKDTSETTTPATSDTKPTKKDAE
jgi:putative FmdB family regulatory protein